MANSQASNVVYFGVSHTPDSIIIRFFRNYVERKKETMPLLIFFTAKCKAWLNWYIRSEPQLPEHVLRPANDISVLIFLAYKKDPVVLADCYLLFCVENCKLEFAQTCMCMLWNIFKLLESLII